MRINHISVDFLGWRWKFLLNQDGSPGGELRRDGLHVANLLYYAPDDVFVLVDSATGGPITEHPVSRYMVEGLLAQAVYAVETYAEAAGMKA